MDDRHSPVTTLLAASRAGDPQAVGHLLENYRPLLRVLADREIGMRLQAKVDASDLVQQTMLEAVRALPEFRGASEGEWQAWLRRILARRISHEVRRHRGTLMRGAANEVSIDQSLAQSSQRLRAMLAAEQTSPSQQAMGNERTVAIAAVLDRLPADYREVIVLRNLEGLSHEEVARRMKRSPGAVRMLWLRALARLREELPGEL
jgi:RNA polymerase sigma-70 factor (ECF subfamily)